MDIPQEIKVRMQFKRDKQDPANVIVKHIEGIETPCVDCGALADRKISAALNHFPCKYWKHTCSCGKIRNPVTHEYLAISSTELSNLMKAECAKNDK